MAQAYQGGRRGGLASAAIGSVPQVASGAKRLDQSDRGRWQLATATDFQLCPKLRRFRNFREGGAAPISLGPQRRLDISRDLCPFHRSTIRQMPVGDAGGDL